MNVHGQSQIRHRGLAAGLLMGPLAWMFDLSFRYFWVERGRSELWAYFVAALGVVLCLLGALLCHRTVRELRAEPEEDAPVTRRSIATLGTVLNLFFAVVICSATLPQLWLGVNDR